MQIPYYQIQAFTHEPFGGNPAGVCALEQWLPDELLQRIATENQFSETAFYVPESPGQYALRWFSPRMEVDLCGHATLAAAHALWHHGGEAQPEITFLTRSGSLHVSREKGRLAMNFPARPAIAFEPPADTALALSAAPEFCGKARDYLFVLKDEEQVRHLRPDLERLAAWDTFGIIVTAPGREVDFVSRFFAPRAGIPEDPVTGSAHCTLIPYWAERLGKKELTARQLSPRGGELFCEALGDRVKIAGQAKTYCQGLIEL